MIEWQGPTLGGKKKKRNGKAIPVIGRGGPYGYETSRLSHFLYSRLTDGGEVVVLKIPGYSFLLKA
jgi:hypothetical protein